MRRSLIIVAALAAVTTTLVGCGPASSNDAGDGPGGNGGNGGNRASCDVAPASLVKQTLGVDVAEPSATENGSVLVCTYSPAPGASDTVILRIDTASGAEQFQTTRDQYATQNMQTADYPGFADEAYTNSISAIGITTNTLVARMGTVEVQVSSSASFDQEKSLEQKIFDALG